MPHFYNLDETYSKLFRSILRKIGTRVLDIKICVLFLIKNVSCFSYKKKIGVLQNNSINLIYFDKPCLSV